MSTLFKFAVLGLGSAGPKLNDCGQVQAMDSSSTSLAVGSASVTADGVAIENNQKVLYSALTSDPGLYLVTGIGTPGGAQFQQLQLVGGNAGLQPSLGDCLYVLEGTANGNTVQCWNGSAWASISVSVGA